jgi:hypothetical protein
MSKTCLKCNGTGWYKYDHNHGKPCEVCCLHDKGFWLLKEHYGNDNGKLCCLKGCGYTKEAEKPGVTLNLNYET